MEGVKAKTVVNLIKNELNKMDKVVSGLIGKKGSSYHIVDSLISFMNSDTVDLIMERCLDANSYEEEDEEEDA